MSTSTSTASVAKIYDSIADLESARLETHPMEREITLRTIRHHLTDTQLPSNTETKTTGPESKRIADIGGGPGKLSFALADQGHSVDLIDLSPELIKLAQLEQERRRQQRQQQDNAADIQEAHLPQLLSSIAVGNALDIHQSPSSSSSSFALAKNSYDAVLLLGPLYHLLDEQERRIAFRNALELAKPGVGLVFCAFVSVEAHLRDLVMRDPARLLREERFYTDYLSTGHYTRLNPTTHTQAQSFHTHSDDIRAFFSQHFVDSATLIDLRSTEGILGGGLDKALVDASSEVVQAWADLLFERYSREERHLGCADHLLAVLRRR